MGQYHYICSLDKREYLNPHKAGDGLKLLEFGCSSNGTMTLLALLLARDNGKGGGDLNIPEGHPQEDIVGSWAGNRIAIVGDYHDKADPLPTGSVHATRRLETSIGHDNPWVEGNSWTDITDDIIAVARCNRWIAQEMVEPKGDGWRQRPEPAVA